ncbi:MAG: IclR family transcriptional regulator [Bryobacteraceae bacterium]
MKKALEILCTFTSGPAEWGVSQISRELHLPKSTTHNLLRTLRGSDFLTQDAETKLFRLGPRVFELGLRASEILKVEAIAYPHLRELREATRETAKVAVPSDGQILIVAAAESAFQLHTRGDAGGRAYLHCTGLGKAILAAMPDDQVRVEVARHGLIRMAPNTITSMDRLERELESIRKAGYALDWEESEAGVRCAAAAVRGSNGRVVAAISVSGPSFRMTESRLHDLAQRVMQHAEAISREFAVRGGR